MILDVPSATVLRSSLTCGRGGTGRNEGVQSLKLAALTGREFDSKFAKDVKYHGRDPY